MKKCWILGAEIAGASFTSYKDLDAYLNGESQTAVNDAVLTYLGKRYAKKIDRSVQLSLYACERLIEKTNLGKSERKHCGIMFGNNYAGWSYVEEQMYGLYAGDHQAINPYVATAWFPAAAQGELSIRNQIFGVSKTFSQDQLSSAVAIQYAMDMLALSKVDYTIVGGHESLISPLIQSALYHEEITSDLFPSSEAACALLLCMKEDEKPRAIASINAIESSANLDVLLQKMSQSSPDVELVLLAPMNMTAKNQQLLLNEQYAVAKVFGFNARCEVPTQRMGEVSGASFALQVVVALWMLENKGYRNILVVGRDHCAERYAAISLAKE